MKLPKYQVRHKTFRGFFVGDGLILARERLSSLKQGVLLLTCLNGTELYVKENGQVRVSTPDEFAKFFQSRQKEI